MAMSKPSDVVILSSPGLGHLIPTIELGKRFILYHNFKAIILAVITSQASEAENQILKSATTPNNLVNIIPILAPDISSHCGWSSMLESITNGVPMIAWPLCAEQRMNATYLAEELRLAVRPEVLPMKKVVGRDEIARMVRQTMVAEDRSNPIRESERNQMKCRGGFVQRMFLVYCPV